MDLKHIFGNARVISGMEKQVRGNRVFIQGLNKEAVEQVAVWQQV